MRVIAVVPAAGSGVRFGAAIPKQYLELGGRAILRWTLERFVSAGVEDVVLPIDPRERSRIAGLTSGLDLRISVIDGGPTRQESVLAGLRHAHDLARGDWVAVHDAVRPCFSRELWERLLAAALESGGAVPVIEPSDTVHRIAAGVVVETPPRNLLGLAQTPQVFRLQLLRDVMENAAQHGLAGTDEAGLVAAAGHRVAAVPGERSNMKITTGADLEQVTASRGEWETW